LSGTYFSLQGGDISEITFEDATHYTLLRSGCDGEQVDGAGDIGCTETGVYSLDTTTGVLSLTDATNTTRTIPFITQSIEAEGEHLDILGTTLANNGGPLTSAPDGGSKIIQCFGASLTEGDPTSRTYGLHCPTQGQASRDGILARAQLWVNARLPYCQSANHAHDADKSCASTCTRTEPAAWDAYRSDCSGFVSWAWGLPPPGRTTGQFGDVSTSIGGNDLQPGDALVNPGKHIVLFGGWTNASHTAAVLQEEPGCSAKINYAHQYTSNVTVSGSSVYVAFNRESFHAIRFNKLCASACSGSDAGTNAPSSVVGGGPDSDGGGVPLTSGTPGSSTGSGGSGGSTGGGTSGGGGGGSPGGGGGGISVGSSSGSGSSCGAPTTECGASCKNLETDNDNCGECGLVCPSMTTCNSGQCTGRACTNDGTCNPGSDGSGLICGPADKCVPGCHSTSQCPGTETCVSGMCKNHMTG
jgi:hypothetical protein